MRFRWQLSCALLHKCTMITPYIWLTVSTSQSSTDFPSITYRVCTIFGSYLSTHTLFCVLRCWWYSNINVIILTRRYYGLLWRFFLLFWQSSLLWPHNDISDYCFTLCMWTSEKHSTTWTHAPATQTHNDCGTSIDESCLWFHCCLARIYAK